MKNTPLLSTRLALLFLFTAVFSHAYPASSNDTIDQSFNWKSVDKRYIHLPVKTGAAKVWMTIRVDNNHQYEFQVELASETPDFYATIETGKWTGKSLTLTAEKVPANSRWLELVKTSNEQSDEGIVYTEKYRPQFHFSPRRGWTNDPNGLVYYKGTYHLFFQHNPYGTSWGNMTWGHAISKDLFHWKEMGDAVYPDDNGTVYSGSAVVDWKNTSGLQSKPIKDNRGIITNPPLVAFYTSQGPELRKGGPITQSMVYSLDEGITWLKYSGNPIIPHIISGNRDPKVFWYEDLSEPNVGHWVMALYMDQEDYALFSSKNLINWEKACDIKETGGSECPDMFRLPVDGNKEKSRWVFWGANGRYWIGSFDGKTFKKENGPYVSLLGRQPGGTDNDYAAQTYSDIPAKDGRRIQLSWMALGKYPNMPFNQQFSVPRELSLRTTTDGIRLFIEPVKEIENLRTSKSIKVNGVLSGKDCPLKSLQDELMDMTVEFDINEKKIDKDTSSVGLNIQGMRIVYDINRKLLNIAGVETLLTPLNGKIKLRLILDRMSMELYANNGIVSFAKCFVPGENSIPIIFGSKDAASFNINAYKLKTVWGK